MFLFLSGAGEVKGGSLLCADLSRTLRGALVWVGWVSGSCVSETDVLYFIAAYALFCKNKIGK